ncbi:MAG: MobA/MobL family protein [Treponema sp.]|nr:MobA/MobL family protein [Treponema sp.]
MAIYHFNVGIISRGNSDSITGASAYISGEKLRDNFTNKIYNYSKRQDVIFKEILLPQKAPSEFHDRQAFLNALNISEKRKDSQLARTIKNALPNELPLDVSIALLKEFLHDIFISVGLCADIAIHKGRFDENRKPNNIEAVHERLDNPHAHIIIPFRPVDGNGFCRIKTQTRYMNKRTFLKKLREDWARLLNREFERRGLDVRVSHESHAARGIFDLEPTTHLGPAVLAMEKKGIRTERGDEHRRIIKRNKEREISREKSLERERSLDRSR